MFGYYGTSDGQLGETADHVNLVWVGPWCGTPCGIAYLQEAAARGIRNAIVDVSYLVYVDAGGGTLRPTPQAAANLRTYFAEVQRLGLLPMLRALYPQDEPELYGLTTDQITATNGVIRMVMAEYGLALPLAVVYSDHPEQPGRADYDVLGVDAYSDPAGALRAQAGFPRDKRTLLVPGGACPWLNDPEPFYVRAQQDPRVFAVVAFIWPDQWGASDNCGIRSAPTRDAYVRVGKRVRLAAP
jgi:hypothetical protein